jgi:enterochelin esterase-like enzyme
MSLPFHRVLPPSRAVRLSYHLVQLEGVRTWEGRNDVKWEWLANQYEANQRLTLRFFVEAGLLEDVSRDGPTLLAANRRFVEILKNKEYPVIYEEVGGTHEPVHWRDTLAPGLISLTK